MLELNYLFAAAFAVSFAVLFANLCWFALFGFISRPGFAFGSCGFLDVDLPVPLLVMKY